MTKIRKSLSCWDIESISSIKYQITDLEDQKTRRLILDFGPRCFISNSRKNNIKRLHILQSFIEKYKDKFNQKQIDSFDLLIKNVSYFNENF